LIADVDDDDVVADDEDVDDTGGNVSGRRNVESAVDVDDAAIDAAVVVADDVAVGLRAVDDVDDVDAVDVEDVAVVDVLDDVALVALCKPLSKHEKKSACDHTPKTAENEGEKLR
jgi:hypothetical protein